MRDRELQMTSLIGTDPLQAANAREIPALAEDYGGLQRSLRNACPTRAGFGRNSGFTQA